MPLYKMAWFYVEWLNRIGREGSKTERELCCHFFMFDDFLLVFFSAYTHTLTKHTEWNTYEIMTKPMIMGNGGSDCTADGDLFILVSFGVSVCLYVYCVCTSAMQTTNYLLSLTHAPFSMFALSHSLSILFNCTHSLNSMHKHIYWYKYNNGSKSTFWNVL